MQYIKNNNYQIAARYLSIKEIFNNKTPIIFSKTHENHYKSAFKIFKSYPIFGSGLKTFRYVCKKPQHNPSGCTTHPHNIFMQFLSELTQKLHKNIMRMCSATAGIMLRFFANVSKSF